ncbi:hypothetical protein EWM64_g2023 [Hericium alpestre]|uniref:Uncharacterized protein n=1 Tax=Hericium alpestre TaxID=135208 RepID=A0A4Z0A6L2_9AGAM|nr:hypothetical protein EWM64_g2023 [Hericium alpestre]
MAEQSSREAFQQLRPICVTLLGNSLLTPSNASQVLSLLSDLHQILQRLQNEKQALSPQLLSYTVFPLTSILQRNAPSAIPDRVLEKLLLVLSTLCENWWWYCDQKTWEQLFMLCGAVIGDIEGKGKGKARDDETKEAAVNCLISLTRERDENEAPEVIASGGAPRNVLMQFQAHAQSPKFIPILGQTIDALMRSATSSHRPLQSRSLHALQTLISLYAPDGFVPSILPGVVSAMTRIALGTSTAKGWSKGIIVAESLAVMRDVTIRSIGDEICLKEGAVRDITDLDDLVGAAISPRVSSSPPQPFSTDRSPSWLRGTSSQLIIALNTITPLVSHSNPGALDGLCSFSESILASTQLTLPQAQPLLLSFLLSLSQSQFDSVSHNARDALFRLLGGSPKLQHSLLQSLLDTARDNLTTLPRLLSSHSDAKVEHVAGQVEAICLLAAPRGESQLKSKLAPVSTGIGKLLGPMGGIESRGSLKLTLKLVFTRTAQISLERMFRALGAAGGEDCLFAIEWLLEGITGVVLNSSDDTIHPRSSLDRLRRAEKAARGIARSVAELWDQEGVDLETPELHVDELESEAPTEHVQGLLALDPSLGVIQTQPRNEPPTQSAEQPLLHQCMSLQVLSITAGILQVRFASLLLHTLYPILHSVVSPFQPLATSGLAALSFVAQSMSYASPANLLLSNFDYALDAISRRLSRQWLDVDALKVLVVLIRLIGRDVVHKAGDVVEECFDRLDEYHGYEVIVEGLVQVLAEVVKVVEEDEDSHVTHEQDSASHLEPISDEQRFAALVDWFKTRHDKMDDEDTNYGPAPRTAWGKSKEEEPPATPTQALTKQIVSRSIYFLTHGSPLVRARILTLLSTAVPVLPESALLPSIHQAWPFILNRFSDAEPFVISAAASLVESLSTHVGPFMARRIWDDVWPRFRSLLDKLRLADSENALARRSAGGVGTESAYTHSHRLYRSIIRTMTAAARHVQAQDSSTWEMMLSFRRFLHREAQEELQGSARELYIAVGKKNGDVVWLALLATTGALKGSVAFLTEERWDIKQNVEMILQHIDRR